MPFRRTPVGAPLSITEMVSPSNTPITLPPKRPACTSSGHAKSIKAKTICLLSSRIILQSQGSGNSTKGTKLRLSDLRRHRSRIADIEAVSHTHGKYVDLREPQSACGVALHKRSSANEQRLMRVVAEAKPTAARALCGPRSKGVQYPGGLVAFRTNVGGADGV
jgi:hypothetical protein